MKIIHTSDLHLDSPLTSRLPAEKLRRRKRELLLGFERLISEARRIGASAIIIAGDLFDSENITEKSLNAVMDSVNRASDLHFYYVAGNHDARLFDGSREAPSNFHTFENDAFVIYELGEGVCITGINKLSDSRFAALDGALRSNEINICVLHGELRDKGYNEESVGRSALVGHGIDYVALGHYHSYSSEQLDSRLTAVYSGTPEGRGFDETGEKGYVLIEIAGGRLTHRFVPFASRKINIIPLPLDGMTEHGQILKRAEELLFPIPSEDMVRLELVGGFTPGLWKDPTAVCEKLGGRFFHFEVKDSSHPEIDPESFRNDKTLKGEFIRLVYADGSLDEKKKQQIINCGIRALMGEEFSL